MDQRPGVERSLHDHGRLVGDRVAVGERPLRRRNAGDRRLLLDRDRDALEGARPITASISSTGESFLVRNRRSASVAVR